MLPALESPVLPLWKSESRTAPLEERSCTPARFSLLLPLSPPLYWKVMVHAPLPSMETGPSALETCSPYCFFSSWGTLKFPVHEAVDHLSALQMAVSPPSIFPAPPTVLMPMGVSRAVNARSLTMSAPLAFPETEGAPAFPSARSYCIATMFFIWTGFILARRSSCLR